MLSLVYTIWLACLCQHILVQKSRDIIFVRHFDVISRIHILSNNIFVNKYRETVSLVVSMSSLVCTFCLTFLCHRLLVYNSRETVLFTVSMSFLLYTSCPAFLCHHLLHMSGDYFVPCFDVISHIHILPSISVTIIFFLQL